MSESDLASESATSESATSDLAGRLARLERQDQRLNQVLELLTQREAAPPAQPRRAREIYPTLVATLVGALALAISAYTAYVQRAQLRAQVWPHLSLFMNDVDVGYHMTNDGTGPARVTAARVAVDDKPVKNWPESRRRSTSPATN